MRPMFVLAFSFLPVLAFGADLPCPPIEPGSIALDGLDDEWRDAQSATGGDAQAGVSIRCDTEGRNLYLEIEATDQRVVRTNAARPGEDHVTLVLGKKKLTIFPASGSIKGKVTPPVKLASSSSDKGFVIELGMPLSFAGLGGAPERIPFALEFADCDSAAQLKTERTAKIDGELAFTAGPSALDAFLQDRGLSRDLVKWQHSVREHGHATQLVLAGKVLAALGDGYGYVELPVRDGSDVHDPQLVDLAGDGRHEVVLRYIEHGEGGSRDVLAAYRLDGNQLNRVFAAEVAKQTNSGKLSTKWTLAKRGRGTDIVLEAQPAQGLTAASYKEEPASDVEPILLPWAQKRAVYTFSGDGYKRK